MIRKRINWPSLESLRRMWKSGMSSSEIAATIPTRRTTLYIKLRRLLIIRPEDVSKPGHHSTPTLRKMRRKAQGPKPYLVGTRKNNASWLGSKNPAWKGGAVEKSGKRSITRAYKDLQVFVLERDGRKCVRCCSKKKLHIHHIKGWKKYPNLRYDSKNVVTVCKSCHDWIHGGANIEQRWRRKSDFVKSGSVVFAAGNSLRNAKKNSTPKQGLLGLG